MGIWNYLFVFCFPLKLLLILCLEDTVWSLNLAAALTAVFLNETFAHSNSVFCGGLYLDYQTLKRSNTNSVNFKKRLESGKGLLEERRDSGSGKSMRDT